MNKTFIDELHSEEEGAHKFISYELKYPENQEEFLQYILPVLKDEYGFGFSLDEKLNNINPARTETLKRFMSKANTPNPDKGYPEGKPWLKNTRSKITEVIAKDFLKALEKVYFTCRVSLEEEDPDMPKRGIDNFGFVFEEVDGDMKLCSIVTSEVKASEDHRTPPPVVHQSGDSMFKSLKEISDIDVRLKKALAKSIDKLPAGEYLEIVCDIAESIENENNIESIKKKIVVVPFLFRRKEYYSTKDYGKFKTHHYEFEPAAIKYYIVAINHELTDFADEVYTKLREE